MGKELVWIGTGPDVQFLIDFRIQFILFYLFNTDIKHC